ncbi:hypothetical protein LTR48_003684 [Friedmanniomyces endolithicus]|uniref:Uncharacterized protein n=1 Tax=Rachicladosporium monterosium TaxID=1507873 RepID=A0ABR0L7J3_9PEZI|nr:hypothetical protein LTR29_007266 [Friedmanniomyces endolithicus]KAK1092773.1 hypothetical protein LTR48_003684 [Friedmanniomyces endolithicus]KAK5144732.1 hypothetical protein LTR32_003397 [Rachicladosporium monterosium]
MLLSRATTTGVVHNITTNNICTTLTPGDLVLPKITFIASLVLCLIVTTTSLLGLAALAYREYARQCQAEEAKAWGRRSRYIHRVSLARMQVDLSYTSQFSGCLVNVVENPEMGMEGPVEIMERERLCEVPALPVRAAAGEVVRDGRRSRFLSLVFDHGLDVWVPKGGR